MTPDPAAAKPVFSLEKGANRAVRISSREATPATCAG
jgi:hypothetical protein